MGESSQKSSSGSIKPVGGALEPCPLHDQKEKDLVVFVTSPLGPGGGVALRVTDSKKKKHDGVSAQGGIAVFNGLNAGACTIETRLSKDQQEQFLEASASASIVKGAFAEAVLKLRTTSLRIDPVLESASAAGLFHEASKQCRPVKLELGTAYGNPTALDGATLSLAVNRDGVELYADAECKKRIAITQYLAPIENAQVASSRRLPLWIKSTVKQPLLVIFAVQRASGATEEIEAGAPAMLQLEWRPPQLAAAIQSLPDTLRYAEDFAVECVLTDADQAAATAKVEVLGKDDAVLHVLEQLDAPKASWTSKWDGKLADGKRLVLDQGPFKVRLTVTDLFGGETKDEKPFKLEPLPSFVQLSFTDPDGVARAFPEGVPVQLVYAADGSTEACTTGPGGLLFDAKGRKGIRIDPDKKEVTFKFPKSDLYVVCEPRGAAKPADALTKTWTDTKAYVEAEATLDARAFRLPGVDWTSEESVWSAKDDAGRWDAAKGQLKPDPKPAGAEDKPAQLVLDPRWQYARFTYQDRFRGGTEQVSSLPVFVSGFPAAPAKDEKPATHSNWTVGDKSETALQCIPWIVRGKDPATAGPTAASELRFATDANTFIESPKEPAKPRAWAKGSERKDASLDRLRFYDLPQEWRSKNWYVRKKPTGKEATGCFYGELADSVAVLGKKDAPLVFSLDDLVLYTCEAPHTAAELKPLPALAAEEPVALFHHSFAKGGDADRNDEGLFLPVADPTKLGTQTVTQIRWPASKEEVLVRAGQAKKPARENYLVKYPDWTRVVIAEGNLYDVFAERSVAKDDTEPDRVVGARAAVRWVDATANLPNVTPQGGASGVNPPVPGSTIIPRPTAVKRPFTVVQPYVEVEAPYANARLDHPRINGLTASAKAEDYGSRVNRDAFVVSEPTAQTARASTLGRFDAVLLRCCGVDETDATKEKAVQLNYFRLGTKFDGTSVRNDDPKKIDYLKTLVTSLTKRWNGPDGAYNPGRPRIEPRDKKKPLAIESLRFFQVVPEAKADLRFDVIGHKPGARDYMNSVEGITQAQDGNEAPEGSGRYTAAHEMGHGGGLLDDYCELWTHASLYQPAIAMLVPGDPYIFDNIDGKESMMFGNKEVRGRHFWQMAEWVYGQLTEETPLQIVHGPDAPPYFLPHHPANRTGSPSAYRNFLAFPWKAVLDQEDANDANKKARFDAYLYALGNDVYSREVLPARAKDKSGKPYDGVLIVSVNIGIESAVADHDMVRGAAGGVISMLRNAFGGRAWAALEVGTQKFERCLILVSPRVLVTTPTGNESYDSANGITLAEWQANTEYTKKSLVKKPGAAAGALVYRVDTLSGNKKSGAVAPVFPAVAGQSVQDGGVKWRACTEADGRKRALAEVLKEKVRWNPLHVMLEIGTPTSEIVETPNEVPRIRIRTDAHLEVWRAALAAAEAAQKAVTATNDHHVAERKKALDDHAAKQIEVNNAVGAFNTANTLNTNCANDYNAKNTQVPPVAPGELAAAAHAWQNAWNDREAKRLTKEQKEAELQVIVDRWTVHNDAIKTLHTAETMVGVLGKAKEIAEALFTADVDPLGDAGFTALTSEVGGLDAAAANVGATRDTVANVLVNAHAAVAAAKAALQLLPATTLPAEVAKVGKALLAVATQQKNFATPGTDDADKKKRAASVVPSLERIVDKATSVRGQKTTWLRNRVQGGWAALDYNKPECVNEVDRAIAPMVRDAVSELVGTGASETYEEQLVRHFGAWLGLTVEKDKVKGYKDLAKGVTGLKTLSFTEPPAPPPPPLPVNNAAPAEVGDAIAPLAPPPLPSVQKAPQGLAPPPKS